MINVYPLYFRTKVTKEMISKIAARTKENDVIIVFAKDKLDSDDYKYLKSKWKRVTLVILKNTKLPGKINICPNHNLLYNYYESVNSINVSPDWLGEMKLSRLELINSNRDIDLALQLNYLIKEKDYDNKKHISLIELLDCIVNEEEIECPKMNNIIFKSN